MPRRRPSRLSPRIALTLLVAVAAVAVVVALVWPPVGPASPGGGREVASPEEAPAPATEVPASPAEVPAPAPAGPRVAIVIDDLGRDLDALDRLLATGEAITFSILPFLPHSLESAERVHAAGEELLLHLPMEPQAYPRLRPGPGGLLVSMDEATLRHQLDDDLAAVPFIDGVNNHMGSRFTEEAAPMALVMEALAGHSLFFLDSRTTSHSVAPEAAEAAGVPWLARDIFLDNTREREAIDQQLDELIDLARERGHAIAIGHPHPATLDALEAALPRLHAAGVAIVPLHDLLPPDPAMWSPAAP